jgi:hypothetical protein
MAPWRLCRPTVADSHLFEEEQDPDPPQCEKLDPDPQLSEKLDPDPH